MTPDELETRLRLMTPEGAVFSFRLAGPGIRMFATLIDYFMVGAVLFGVSRLFSLLPQRIWGLQALVLAILGLVLPIAYDVLLEWRMRGQTVGKRLFHLRVMDAHGLPLSFPQVLTRNLMRVIDALPLYFVGGVASILSRHYRRLGDQLASTVVVRESRVRIPDVRQLLAEKYNSFLNYPHLATRLRQSATPEEASLALEALLRRDQLSPEARVRVYREIADYFQSRVAFPEELRDSLSDEHYLRNVVAVLYPRSFVA
jgi:uncharacterized RDD family membrane protein YckC